MTRILAILVLLLSAAPAVAAEQWTSRQLGGTRYSDFRRGRQNPALPDPPARIADHDDMPVIAPDRPVRVRPAGKARGR